MIAFSECTLATMARNDGAAFERLLQANWGLVISAAKRAVGCRSWHRFRDEAIQGAIVGLWRAVQRHGQDQRPWSHIAYSMARAEAKRYIRDDCRGMGCSSASIEGPAKRPGLPVWESIPPYLEPLAEVLASGSSRTAAGQLLGLSVDQVRYRVQQIKGMIHE